MNGLFLLTCCQWCRIDSWHDALELDWRSSDYKHFWRVYAGNRKDV